MKTSKLLIVVAVATAFSCTKETPAVHNGRMSFTASVDPVTKTLLTETNGQEWVAGDEIAVFSNGTSQTLSTSQSGASVVFEGECASADEYFAIYPAALSSKIGYDAHSMEDNATLGCKEIITAIPAIQIAQKGSFAPGQNIMIGYTTGTNFEFKNVCGIIKVVVSSTDITSVTITAANGEYIAGNVAVSWNNGEPAVRVTKGQSKVQLVAESGTLEPGNYYVNVIPGTLSNGFTIRFNKGSLQTACVKSTASATIARSAILNIGNPDGVANFKNRIDLSANGTANCYVITGAGEYRFKDATGNAADTPSGSAYIDWLWADVTGLVKDFSYENDGYFTFTAAAGKGNTIVAGRRTSDNRIMWTWHLWSTDDPSTTICYGNSTDSRYLDRNLGATTATADQLTSYGLYYEWGRKDPFPASSSVNLNGYVESGGPVGASTYTINQECTDVFKSVNNYNYTTRGNELAILRRQPLTYVAYSKGSYSWFVLPDETATEPSETWKTEGATLWGESLDGKTVAKSVYDPCPPGWKVPTNLNNTLGGLTATATTYGWNYAGAEGTTLHLPAAGYRFNNKSGRLGNPGLNTYYWSALARAKSGNGDMAWAWVSTKNTSAPAQSSIQPTNGCPVRCEKFVE